MSNYTTKEEFESAYKTLNATFKTGRTRDLRWRKWQLKQLYWMLDENEDLFTEAIQKDLNKPSFEVWFMELNAVKQDILDQLNNIEKWSKGEAPEGAGFLFGTLGKAWLRKAPLGVCLVIGAWNFPLQTLLAPACGALGAGNCIIMKPSDATSATQDLFIKLGPKYLDQSALRFVSGGPSETGFMLEHKFDKIIYTGGGRVGRIIAQAAAKHLTPVTLELGGQAPSIVCKSANIDLAAKRIAAAKLNNNGQICINTNHVLVDPSIHDQFVERMIHWTKTFIGDTEGSGLSHIVNENHFNRIKNLLDNTTGNVKYGGKTDASSNYIHPTIITDVNFQDSTMSEEIFGPLTPVIRSTTQHAIDTIKSMPHPLAIYIFSNNAAEIEHILYSTTSGGATVNDVMMHVAVPSAPFGGVGESGNGATKGKIGFDACSHTRTVVTIPAFFEYLLAFKYLPYSDKNKKMLAVKPSFKKGETLEMQKVGGGGVRKFITRAAMLALIVAALDRGSGGRVGFVRYLGETVSRFGKPKL